jgi:hypothetical protein
VTQGPLQIGPAAPDPDEILEALKRAVRHDPGVRDRKAEDLSKDLVTSGYLHEEPDPVLVAEMLGTIEPEGPEEI